MDRVDATTRSRMMAAVKSKNTGPEMAVRSLLHAAGYRFRLHVAGLPGRPDIVLPRYRALIHVHGCFWHGHGCSKSRLPATRAEFWKAKINANSERDRANLDAATSLGWRQLVIWECAVSGRLKLPPDRLLDRIASFLRGGDMAGTIEPE